MNTGNINIFDNLINQVEIINIVILSLIVLEILIDFFFYRNERDFSESMLAAEISLLYQFFLHTKKIKKLGFLELIFNTPSNHRVHHGSNNKYLDKNYGSILIIWDRLFGTYQKEEEKVIYGLTKPINSKNPLVINITELSRTWKGFMQSENLYRKALWLFSRPRDSNFLI